MRLALCDDNEIIRKNLISLIEDYMEIKHITIEYKTFDSYESAQKEIDNFDLFILDYNMNDDSINPADSDLMTGMDFAKLVRAKADPHKGVVFLTSNTDIVYDAFEVRAHRFLVKPVDREKLFKTLDDFFNSKIESGTIVIKINNESHVIDINSIYYFEVARKDIFIHCEDEVLKCHKTIGEFEEELKPYNFFRAHRSFLVNVSKVDTINRQSAIMKNGEEVYVSKKCYSEFCEVFLDNKQRG